MTKLNADEIKESVPFMVDKGRAYVEFSQYVLNDSAPSGTQLLFLKGSLPSRVKKIVRAYKRHKHCALLNNSRKAKKWHGVVRRLGGIIGYFDDFHGSSANEKELMSALIDRARSARAMFQGVMTPKGHYSKQIINN